ncbi:MAG TPA: serine protease [Gammaproteobacteria bacterium]|nr:serine protease [Gammaproteobacteria bacterium]
MGIGILLAMRSRRHAGVDGDCLQDHFQAAALAATLFFGAAWTAMANDARTLFSEYSDRIYQVRILDRSSGKQAGLGSGFLISADGEFVTNYHVIAEYANHPKRYSIEFVRHNGEKGSLSLINLDVVNDLALLRLDDAPGYYLRLAAGLPAQGESIYSIGNPHDLGWTVIPGTYNGIAAYSVYERIHFSGSVNPGMSGGPVLNAAGRVIGVNVATAGNQLSFLVPLNRLAAFVARSARTAVDVGEIDTVVAKQLKANQREVIGALVRSPWEAANFGDAVVPSELAAHIRCWGFSDDDPEIRYAHSATSCNSEEQIYLSSEFNTGNVAYQFNWLETDELNTLQFYNMYKEKIANAYPDNDAGKEDVTRFVCHEDFVRSRSLGDRQVVTKSAFCVREYRRYRGLYDVLFFGASVHRNKSALISHFTLAGVEQGLALDFARKFVANVQWK